MEKPGNPMRLSLSYDIIKYTGTYVDAKEGEGTVFVIYLPT
jgi:hypothetical protein